MSKCRRCGSDPCVCPMPSRPGEWKPKPQPWPGPSKAVTVREPGNDPKPGCFNPSTVAILLITIGLILLGIVA